MPDTDPADPPVGPDDEPIIALTVDDAALHVGPAAEVLAHLLAEVEEGGALDPAQWDFFTRDGAPLRIDPAGGQTLVRTAPTQAPSDLERRLVLDRIDLFLARVQVKHTRTLVRGEAADHSRVPRLSGDLPDVAAGLAVLLTLSTDPDPHSKNWVHNLGHRLGA